MPVSLLVLEDDRTVARTKDDTMITVASFIKEMQIHGFTAGRHLTPPWVHGFNCDVNVPARAVPFRPRSADLDQNQMSNQSSPGLSGHLFLVTHPFLGWEPIQEVDCPCLFQAKNWRVDSKTCGFLSDKHQNERFYGFQTRLINSA
jgi:hypothetical protein